VIIRVCPVLKTWSVNDDEAYDQEQGQEQGSENKFVVVVYPSKPATVEKGRNCHQQHGFPQEARLLDLTYLPTLYADVTLSQ
jgi:hypothetical protein